MNYQISVKGFDFIHKPPRNARGIIPLPYYRKVLIMFVLENGIYAPGEFKQFIKNKNVFESKDLEITAYSKQPKWSHYIDRAKQFLLDRNILIEEMNGEFILNHQNIEVSNIIDNYIKPIK